MAAAVPMLWDSWASPTLAAPGPCDRPAATAAAGPGRSAETESPQPDSPTEGPALKRHESDHARSAAVANQDELHAVAPRKRFTEQLLWEMAKRVHEQRTIVRDLRKLNYFSPMRAIRGADRYYYSAVLKICNEMPYFNTDSNLFLIRCSIGSLFHDIETVIDCRWDQGSPSIVNLHAVEDTIWSEADIDIEREQTLEPESSAMRGLWSKTFELGRNDGNLEELADAVLAIPYEERGSAVEMELGVQSGQYSANGYTVLVDLYTPDGKSDTATYYRPMRPSAGLKELTALLIRMVTPFIAASLDTAVRTLPESLLTDMAHAWDVWPDLVLSETENGAKVAELLGLYRAPTLDLEIP